MFQDHGMQMFIITFSVCVLCFNAGRAQHGWVINTVPEIAQNLFQNKCIEDLGCFYTGPPLFYHELFRPISVSPTDSLNTEFLVYTPTNPNDPQVLKPTNESLSTSTVDPSLETKILIHGFLTKLDPEAIFFKMKDELLKRKAMNVIIVDWSKHNINPYHQAVANARAIGAQVAKLINYHMDRKLMDPETVHIIGHSLGAHCSGWAAERVPGIGRITGLDPAGPWFQNAASEVRLDRRDANFVDTIHTNAATNMAQGLGIKQAIGHADFYPNGGSRQPGCFYEALIQSGGLRNATTDMIANVCSHSRANQLFLDSINKRLFIAVQCKNYNDFRQGKCTSENSETALMGYDASKPHTEGTRFYLDTTE